MKVELEIFSLAPLLPGGNALVHFGGGESGEGNTGNSRVYGGRRCGDV